MTAGMCQYVRMLFRLYLRLSPTSVVWLYCYIYEFWVL